MPGPAVRCRLLAAAVVVATLAGACATPTVPPGAANVAPGAGAGWRSGPYQDVSLGMQPGTATFRSPPWLGPATPGRMLLWAFATGECGSERWGEGIDTEAFARQNVAAFERAGRDFVVATGGEAGIFTCASDAAMARFVQRYDSPRLQGIDFDIEGRQTAAQIRDLAARARFVQRRWPRLRLSYTLATHAGSDAAQRSLNATGETVLIALREAGVQGAIINLMVMNYGPGDARWCVVKGSGAAGAAAACDMARSAIQAAHNLHRRHGVPYAQIALTLMLGENDVAGNLTTPDDAAFVVREAKALGLAGVHHWSLHRDQPCPAGSPRVSAHCHGLPGVAAGAFEAVLAR